MSNIQFGIRRILVIIAMISIHLGIARYGYLYVPMNSFGRPLEGINKGIVCLIMFSVCVYFITFFTVWFLIFYGTPIICWLWHIAGKIAGEK